MGSRTRNGLAGELSSCAALSSSCKARHGHVSQADTASRTHARTYTGVCARAVSLLHHPVSMHACAHAPLEA